MNKSDEKPQRIVDLKLVDISDTSGVPHCCALYELTEDGNEIYLADMVMVNMPSGEPMCPKGGTVILKSVGIRGYDNGK